MKRSILKLLLIHVLEKYSIAIEDFMLRIEEQELEKAIKNHKTSSFKQGLVDGYNKGVYNYE